MRLDYQLVGVSQKRMVPLYAKVLSKLGRRAALVCHSADGMDEISTSVPTTAAWVTPGNVRMTLIRPRAYGLKAATARDLSVSSVKESRIMAENILSGRNHGPARDAIVLNAAYGLFLCGKARNVREGIHLAQGSIDSGKARNVLNQLKVFSN
jgi:anthranilate phosphoribosyltransferase